MTPNDRQAFLEIVIGFAELKGKQLSAPALELYWRAMQSWPIEQFRAAAAQLVRTCEFMPTPKDFEDLRRAARPTAGEAWLAAVDGARAIRFPERNERGIYPPMRYANTAGDPVIDRVVEMLGGFDAIRMCATDKLHFLERRFSEFYAELVDVEETREALPALTSEPYRPRVSTGGLQRLSDLTGKADDA